MENSNTTLIENVLKQDGQDIDFEPIPEENDSPLAQPVVKKSNTAGDVSAAKQHTPADTDKVRSGDTTTATTSSTAQQPDEPLTDAPEQEIDAEPTEQEKQQMAGPDDEEFSMPLEHARLMADSIIGTINNTVLEVGGGYFVTIRKHKDFYDFEEIVQVIEQQNVKNIKRLKLDEEDKALLRPLLIHFLRKKAVVMSIERQLLMVTLSLLIKKTKVVMEIRAENEALVERIRDIIRKEIRAAKDEQEETEEETNEGQQSQVKEPVVTDPDKDFKTEPTETLYEEVVHTRHGPSGTGLPDEVLETY